MYEFDESRPEFKGFNAYYRDEIIQPLIAKDQLRRAMVKRFYMCMAGAAGLAAIAAFGAWQLHSPQLSIFAIVACFGGGAALGNYFLKSVKAKTKEHLVGKVCKYVGLDFQSETFLPMNLMLFRNLHLLPKADRESFEDQIKGEAHGASFTLHEAHLEKENRNSKGPRYTTVFRGVMMRMDFHQKFMGETIIVRDSGFFNRKKKGAMKRVGLVDPVFEKAFEAYGTDQVEARYLLTPTFMQRLVDLERLFEGKKLRAAFSQGELLIAIEAPNQFESGSMFKPLTDPARTQKILNEIGTVFDIIDGVLKPQNAR